VGCLTDICVQLRREQKTELLTSIAALTLTPAVKSTSAVRSSSASEATKARVRNTVRHECVILGLSRPYEVLVLNPKESIAVFTISI
jgi:uncharacterized membrane protein